MALLEVTNVKKIYSTRFGGNKVQALFNVTFSVEEGEYVHAGSAVGTVAGTAAFELRKDGLSVMPVFAN